MKLSTIILGQGCQTDSSRSRRRVVFVTFLLMLLALTALQARPIAMQALDVRPDPQSVRIVGTADGSHFCVEVPSCDTMTPNTTGIDMQQVGLLAVAVGVIVSLLLGVVAPLPRLAVSLLSPPPRPAFA